MLCEVRGRRGLDPMVRMEQGPVRARLARRFSPKRSLSPPIRSRLNRRPAPSSGSSAMIRCLVARAAQACSSCASPSSIRAVDAW